MRKRYPLVPYRYHEVKKGNIYSIRNNTVIGKWISWPVRLRVGVDQEKVLFWGCRLCAKLQNLENSQNLVWNCRFIEKNMIDERGHAVFQFVRFHLFVALRSLSVPVDSSLANACACGSACGCLFVASSIGQHTLVVLTWWSQRGCTHRRISEAKT